MTTHHTTESVERLAVELSTPIDPGLGFKIELQENTAAAKTLRDLAAERDHILATQRYTYIGKDGKPVLARDLEDERDALRARLDVAKRVIGIVYTGLEFMAADDDDAGQMASRLVRPVRAFLNGGGNG